VREVRDVRARWIGHTIRSEIEVGLAPDTTVEQAEDIAAEVRHAVMGSVEHVTEVAVEPRVSRAQPAWFPTGHVGKGVASPGSGGSFRLRPTRGPPAMAHPSDHESGPTITAKLDDGPLKGQRIETQIVEGRAPSTIDATADDGSTCRYVLAEWTQSGPSAAYTFLYVV
jgi:zinc transporter family protein